MRTRKVTEKSSFKDVARGFQLPCLIVERGRLIKADTERVILWMKIHWIKASLRGQFSQDYSDVDYRINSINNLISQYLLIDISRSHYFIYFSD